MPGRLKRLQIQARELGRLRAGYSEPYIDKRGKERLRPVASKVWIISSPQRSYIDAAAELWGGTPEEWQPQGNGPKVWRVFTERDRLDVLLPPGDPLSQYNEMWSRGGCQRRCDLETELLSDRSCLCRAEFGDQFHQQDNDKVCQTHTRLNVFIPELDLGTWRVESMGYWPSVHLTGHIDLIKARVGPEAVVPIWIGIEPRTKIANGKTSHYIEVVAGIRGVSFGEILSGHVPTLAIGGSGPAEVGGGEQRQAIDAGPAPAGPEGEQLTAERVMALIPVCKTRPQLAQLWQDAGEAGAITDEVKAAFEARGKQFKPDAEAAEAEPAPADEPETVEGEVEGEVVPDREAVWMQVMAEAATKGWDLPTVEAKYREHMGHDPSEEEIATAHLLDAFLDMIRKGEVQ